MKRIVPLVLATMLLGACASAPTLYQPAAGPQAVGFSEYRIEPGRYRITFRGGSGAPPEQVADFALLRAADLALADGYDWFRVSDRFIRQAGPDNSPRLSIGTGGGSFGRSSSFGVGVGTSFNLGGGPALSQTLEVLMGKGAKPAGADIYDAREVRRQVGARV
ncbi:MAG: hypothetical protein Q8M88_14570 [Phenylobacterium sp.]|uniref:CC0125/CC1285 family lipoprotein n=1 Tax=Phenylobacterium sp. TaxID=1871053 RepID=UPI00273431FE|nr:hypothetical protein [Phenylobacterium sp.]MDP3175653.1 hypothetical protein [Phenylobacterium sp.]